MDLLLHFLLLGAVIFMLAETMPGMRVDGFGTAFLVAVVYGLINVTLGTVLKIFSIPFIVISIGFFLFIINAFLLWITDELFEGFEIRDAGTTFIAAVIITLSDTALGWIF